MSIEQAKVFINKCKEGEELADAYKVLLKKLVDAKKDEQAVNIAVTKFASEEGYDVTVEELQQLIQGEVALSDEELEQVAGGGWAAVAIVSGSEGEDGDAQLSACWVVGYSWSEEPSNG